MDLESVDKLEQSMELVDGMKDIIVFIEMMKQNTAIPVTILCPFKALLDQVYLLLEEIERVEKEKLDHEGKREKPV